MIRFLAYLELKLWLTNQKLDINSNPTKGNLGLLAKSHNLPAD